jgi:hypothetical protein
MITPNSHYAGFGRGRVVQKKSRRLNMNTEQTAALMINQLEYIVR